MKTPRRTSRAHATLALVVLAIAAALPACRATDTLLDMKVAAAQPRPAELDRLNAFVGEWTGSAELRDLTTGRVTAVTSRVHSRWVSGGRFLLHEGERTTDGVARPFTAITAWDAERRIFRHWHFADDGSVVAGEDWSPRDDGSWTVARRVGPQRVESTMRIAPGGDRIDSRIEILGEGGRVKLSEGTGTATRVR